MADAALQAARDLRNSGDILASIEAFSALLEARPFDIQLWMDAAFTCGEGRNFQAAIEIFKQVHTVQPNSPEPCHLIGMAYETLGEYESGLIWHTKAVNIGRKIGHTTGLGQALIGVGNCCFRLGLLEDGNRAYDNAIRHHAGTPSELFAKGMARLARGDWRRGWRDFEQRWRMESMVRAQKLHGTRAELLPPKWDGQGKGRVLLFAEQGSGDTIIALRWVPEVARRSGERPALVIQDEIVPLAQKLVPEADIYHDHVTYGAVGKLDYHSSLLSLPDILKINGYEFSLVPQRVQAPDAPAL